MKLSTPAVPLLFTALSLAPLALSQDAPITQQNPLMASIQATLQASKPIQGSITGVSNTNGTGVNFNINFYQFPNSGGPFSYYIADAGVPSSLSCASLTTPLNPYSGSSSSCTENDPSSCAIGSLSGKHGTIASGSDGADFSFQKFYLDLYLSTIPGSKAYFGGRAIVVADKNGVPVNCAEFPGTASTVPPSTASSSGSASSTSASAAASSVSSTSASASAAATSSAAAAAVAQRVVGTGMGIVAAVAVLVL